MTPEQKAEGGELVKDLQAWADSGQGTADDMALVRAAAAVLQASREEAEGHRQAVAWAGEQLDKMGEETRKQKEITASYWAALVEASEETRRLREALEALLDHAERIQEHVPKSEFWYVLRDASRIALASPAPEREAE